MSRKKTLYVYVGPDLPFGQPIMRNAIMAAEPEKIYPGLPGFFESHKNLRKLFVPVADLARARNELAQPGSALAVFYGEIKFASDNFKAAKK